MRQIFSVMAFVILAALTSACGVRTEMMMVDQHGDQYLAYTIKRGVVVEVRGLSEKALRELPMLRWTATMSPSSKSECSAAVVFTPRQLNECSAVHIAGEAKTKEEALAIIRGHFNEFVANNKLRAPATTPTAKQ